MQRDVCIYWAPLRSYSICHPIANICIMTFYGAELREDEMRGLKRPQAGIHPVFGGAYMEPVKRSRLVWTTELHQRFEEAVAKAGGIDVAVPKTVLEVCLLPIPNLRLLSCRPKFFPCRYLLRESGAAVRTVVLVCLLPPTVSCLQHMAVPGLTRDNVASHLQKHRMNVKKTKSTNSCRAAENTQTNSACATHSGTEDDVRGNGIRSVRLVELYLVSDDWNWAEMALCISFWDINAAPKCTTLDKLYFTHDACVYQRQELAGNILMCLFMMPAIGVGGNALLCGGDLTSVHVTIHAGYSWRDSYSRSQATE